MKLTTKGRYAVTAVLDLALHCDTGPVSLAAIAARQNLSIRYLEQLFAKLKQAQVVRAVRGPGGGYLLHTSVATISVSHIIDAVEDRIDATKCGGAEGCQNGLVCLTHTLWQDLNDQVHGFLSSITLESLMQRENVQQVASRQDQRILLTQQEFLTRTDNTNR